MSSPTFLSSAQHSSDSPFLIPVSRTFLLVAATGPESMDLARYEKDSLKWVVSVC